MRSVGTVLALVVLATLAATFARRWRIPAPCLLVVAGLSVALLPGTPEIRISPEIIGLVVLPPLLYASAEELSWRELRAVWKPVGVRRSRSPSPTTDRPLVLALVLVLTTSVVVVTPVVQGFTLAAVVRRSGISLEPDHTEREEAATRCSLAGAGLSRLDEISELEAVPRRRPRPSPPRPHRPPRRRHRPPLCGERRQHPVQVRRLRPPPAPPRPHHRRGNRTPAAVGRTRDRRHDAKAVAAVAGPGGGAAFGRMRCVWGPGFTAQTPYLTFSSRNSQSDMKR